MRRAAPRRRAAWLATQGSHKIYACHRPLTSSRTAAKGRSNGGRQAKIVRTPSGEHIASYVRRLIFEGELRPGMRVPQDAIAQDLGVSRIPVREALIVLEREGWVTNEMHRGAFINTLDEPTVHDHYELFGLIYGFAAEACVGVCRDDLPEQLGEIQTQFAKGHNGGRNTTIFPLHFTA